MGDDAEAAARVEAKARMAARKEAIRLKKEAAAAATAEPAATMLAAAEGGVTPRLFRSTRDASAPVAAPPQAAPAAPPPADTAAAAAAAVTLAAKDTELQAAVEAQRTAERAAAGAKEMMQLQAEGIGTMQDELGRLHGELTAAKAAANTSSGPPAADAKQLRSLRRRAKQLSAELAASKEAVSALASEAASGLGTAAAGVARLKGEVTRSAQKLASLESASESLREQLTTERAGKQQAQVLCAAAEQRAAAADERVATETRQLRDEAEEAVAEREALEKATKTRNARFAKVQTAHNAKLEALEAELAETRTQGGAASQQLEADMARLKSKVSALETLLEDSEASAAEAADAAADGEAEVAGAREREQVALQQVAAAREEARQAIQRAELAEVDARQMRERAEAADAAGMAVEDARVEAADRAASEVEAAGGAIEALVAERDAQKLRAGGLSSQIDSLVSRQGRLVEEMMAQDETLQRLLGEGAVDRRQVGGALVAFFQANDRQRKEEILQLLANMLGLDQDQCIEIGLVSRWEHLQPEMSEKISAGEVSASDAFATFLAAER